MPSAFQAIIIPISITCQAANVHDAWYLIDLKQSGNQGSDKQYSSIIHSSRDTRHTMYCDNKAVVDCIRSGTSKSPPVMTLLRELFFVCTGFNFTVTAAHIAGQFNCIADSLSRFRMEEFRRLAPAAQAQPDRAVLPFQFMCYNLDIQVPIIIAKLPY